jgi:hypothetical protein
MAATIYAKGLIAYPPRPNAPKTLVTSLRFSIEEFKKFIISDAVKENSKENNKYGMQFDVDIFKQEDGRYSASLNTFKPNGKEINKEAGEV